MALDTFIAGRYTGAYATVDVGITERGYELQGDYHAQQVTPSDAFGDSILDLIYRGCSWWLQFDSKAYKTGSITPFYPWGSLGALGVIGRLGSDVASAMVLTATGSTPAATSPATLTAPKAIAAANFNPRLLFSSELRLVPVRLQCLPYDAGSQVFRHFALTP